MFASSRLVRVAARPLCRSVRHSGGVQPPAPPVAASSSLRDTIGLYAELSKTRLSALVVMTSSAGYLMADWAAVQPLSFAAVSAGTALAACSANTFNQVWEVRYDKMMKRTQNRPLPSGRMSKAHALGFGVGVGAAGTGVLAAACNPLTAALGAGSATAAVAPAGTSRRVSGRSRALAGPCWPNRTPA